MTIQDIDRARLKRDIDEAESAGRVIYTMKTGEALREVSDREYKRMREIPVEYRGGAASSVPPARGARKPDLETQETHLWRWKNRKRSTRDDLSPARREHFRRVADRLMGRTK
jgi:hypothetical protein